MKKILILLGFIVSSVAINAQVGRIYTVAVDTINGNETVNFTLGQITGGYETLTIQALCTQVGGTSDGTLILQASVDGTSYITIQDDTYSTLLKSYPNDTLTITNGAVGTWIVKNVPYNFYRLRGAGTTGDSTLITAKYVYK